MAAVAGFFSALPAALRAPVLFALPCFLLLLLLAWPAARPLARL
ncbi:C-5 sterol desaturase, partial [Mycobacterium tuberculosis]